MNSRAHIYDFLKKLLCVVWVSELQEMRAKENRDVSHALRSRVEQLWLSTNDRFLCVIDIVVSDLIFLLPSVHTINDLDFTSHLDNYSCY
jgi:hypothetical protein